MSAKKTFSPTITLEAQDSMDATRRVTALSTILQHIETDNLETLARKASKPGINQKIRQFASFI
ncbi:hypothetical protein [Hymenobacter metallilatus]|uniref:Uncharacterized protein n=1 Tax=Hymenobacter metallilatus TaxID=2493666 RepID=A0A3R9ML43_9BACT|nr:hypothetical protein [Hymenobacter metallilatus]RSK24189.1 hypothetical protein EI290_20630 [Hymenobacter metallilatus]